ncbi:efflux RND transporter periplasmic adaptor subunit [Larkinella terrae]|uniref:Efflux RND transporter periplasmic adaptor subunit n=1 Tax=Larkinella terrae TaxID=2025311 RepID=A0A7K0EIB5_9BACT|nr:efflux RND transporter periplasmic adaptor subunit [Larkinella terrae]MRS61579.1 efflux RND transporter periplasmic adaptor subunit [Larkinella terrae]
MNKIIIGGFLLMLGMASLGCQKKAEVEEAKAFMLSDTMLKRIRLDTARVQPVRNELTLVGRVIADENKVIKVFPLVGGNVETVPVELGDYVRKGQTLALIRSGEVADLERQMIQAQSGLLVAQKNLRVAQDLNESKLNAQRDVVQAQNEVNQAEAELTRLREVFKIYGLGKSTNYTVKAPISGFIIEKNVNPGLQLRSDNADNLFTIGEINDVWVLANVNESDIGRVRTGMDAQIETLSYPDQVFRGKVDKIYNVLDPSTKAMSVRIKLSNADYKLKPQMHATIRLSLATGEQLTTVPTDAVIFDHSKNFVVVYRNRSDLEVREVSVHKTLRKVTYLDSGVRSGERVISKNQILLYNALSN